MATTTPNFGWPVPTSTDLVKDGATAIEALGDSIDASLLDLKGGTTGQVLSKNSNTDMDFTWVTDAAGDITGVTAGTGISGGGTSGTVTVTNSMATAIDAKGDLVAGTAADTFARLAVGANGTILTADSAEATGLKWAAPAGGGDYVLLNTYTMPGSATSYSVNNIFSSTYTNYVIIGKMNNSSTNSLSIKLRVSGTDSSASYSSFIQYWGITAGDGVTKVNNSTAGIYLENAGTSNWISMEILNPFDAAATGFIHSGIQQLGDGYGHFGSGFHNVATSYDGFTLVTGGANISGTFSVYGLKK
jgi:hypothetical protein